MLSIRKHRLRVLFVLPSLRGGGAERVVGTLAARLPADEFEAHLALVRAEGVFLNDVPDHVVVHDLQASRTLRAWWPFIRLVRRLRPQIILSSPSHVSGMIGLAKPFLPDECRFVPREVSQLSVWEEMGQYPPRLRWLTRRAYRQADRIICLTRSMQEDLTQAFGIDPRQTSIIPNPVVPPDSSPIEQMLPVWPGGEAASPRVLAVGRLGYEKGYDRLLAAFPALLQREPQASLVILGEGEQRPVLEEQIRDLGLERHVLLPGFQPVEAWYRQCDLFVLCSRVEGIPNVLLEAVSREAPVVVLQHPGGTCEIMQQLGLADRFVPDLSTWDEQWFDRPDPEVAVRSRQFYNVERIVEEYAAVFRELTWGRQARAA